MLLLRVQDSVSIFICAHDSSAHVTLANRAGTVICSAVVANSSSRFHSFAAFPAISNFFNCRPVVYLGIVLMAWFQSKCMMLQLFCVCVLSRCNTLPFASGVEECFRHFLSLSSTANSPARCNDSNSHNVHSHLNTSCCQLTNSMTNTDTPASAMLKQDGSQSLLSSMNPFLLCSFAQVTWLDFGIKYLMQYVFSGMTWKPMCKAVIKFDPDWLTTATPVI